MFFFSTDSVEEQVVKECIDSSVIFFKPSRLLFASATDNTLHPTVPCDGEFKFNLELGAQRFVGVLTEL